MRNTKVQSISLEPDVAKKLNLYAREKNKSKSSFVSELILNYATDQNPKQIKRKLGMLEGIATYKIMDDFKITDEELLNS